MGSSALDDGSLLAQSVPLESEHPRARAPGRTEEADRGGGPRRRTEEADRGGGPRRRTEEADRGLPAARRPAADEPRHGRELAGTARSERLVPLQRAQGELDPACGTGLPLLELAPRLGESPISA
jgi:hypothetical protein